MNGFTYRGSPKHKNRPARGRKGTLCPEWTHTTATGQRFQDERSNFAWASTPAQALLAQSEPNPDGSGKRYATSNGIAFAAMETNDGTWHGYPEPWNRVPADLKDRWLEEKKVKSSFLKRYKDFPDNNVAWPLESDDD